MMDKKILQSITKNLAANLPSGSSALLYGSQARNDARPDSDWDILVLIDKDKLVPSDYDTITYPLYVLGWENGIDISPMLYTKKEWERYRITPFYHNVQQDAIQLI